jgi:hypothetical protein
MYAVAPPSEHALPLTAQELTAVAGACRGVRVRYFAPQFLRRYIPERLGGQSPALAERVRALSDAQMEELRRFVRTCQDSDC